MLWVTMAAADGLRDAVASYQKAQDDLVDARNRLARTIAGAAMSGMRQNEIVKITGYTREHIRRICRGAGKST